MDVRKFHLILISLAFGVINCWQRKQCSTAPYCFCHSKQNYSRIFCSHVGDISEIRDLLQQYRNIQLLRLRGYFTRLPDRSFGNVSIQMLEIQSPLREIADEALFGVAGLQNVGLNQTHFEEYPKALANQGFKTLGIIHGFLTAIDDELQNMTSAKKICLTDNKLKFLSPRAFDGTDYLEVLDLSFNELAYLDPDTFEHMKSLKAVNLSENRLLSVQGCFLKVNPKTINLYGNNLSSIRNVFHRGMWSLHYLDIGGNPKLQVNGSDFNNTIEKLNELHLSYNRIEELDPMLLKNLKFLHTLYLNGNFLTSISPSFFRYTQYINTFEASDNMLNSTDDLFPLSRRIYKNLRFVKLDGNKISSLNLSEEFEGVLSLDVSRNRIKYLEVDSLKNLEKVQKVNISGNSLMYMEKGSFADKRHLIYLDISHNYLRTLNGSLDDLGYLHYLSVRSSQLESLSDDLSTLYHLKVLDLHDNNLRTVYRSFRNLTDLLRLDISKNQLRILTEDSFGRKRHAIHLSHLRMADNPWICDCRMSWLLNWLRSKRHYLEDEPVCQSPLYLRGVPIRSLNTSALDFVYRNCPSPCTCFCEVDGEDVFTNVNCSSSDLTEVPTIFPATTRRLNLRDNSIRDINGSEFAQLHNLQVIDLENNKIEEVQFIFASSAHAVYLAGNLLKSIAIEEMNVSHVSQFTLSRNPWSCTCDTWRFRNWLLEKNDSVKDIEDVRCGSQETLFLRNKIIIYLTYRDLCPLFALWKILVIAACCGILLILLAATWCFRRTISVLLYTAGCTILKRKESLECSYDIFLLYSESDEDFSQGVLAKRLENSEFEICVPSRDVAPPRTFDRVSSFIPQCNKVVVLLTKNFLRDQNCINLLKHAMNETFIDAFKQHILLILYGQLPRIEEMVSDVQTALKHCAIIRFQERFFWKKLIYWLPKKTTKADDDDRDEALLWG